MDKEFIKYGNEKCLFTCVKYILNLGIQNKKKRILLSICFRNRGEQVSVSREVYRYRIKRLDANDLKIAPIFISLGQQLT